MNYARLWIGASVIIAVSFGVLSCLAIAGFCGAGPMWGRQTNLAIADYWRWWVVHLWVEGFFEVFATVVIAFLFTSLGLLRVSSAILAAWFTTIIYLAGGIIGTFHHLYFTGTPTPVLALGAVFSALEIVPLVLIGIEGMWYARSAEFLQTDLMTKLRWLRIVGDTVFAFGTMGLAWFVIGFGCRIGYCWGAVLQRYPWLLDTFVGFGFTPLRNPVLRNTVARWTTIAQAARRLDIDLPTLLEALYQARPAAPIHAQSTSETQGTAK